MYCNTHRFQSRYQVSTNRISGTNVCRLRNKMRQRYSRKQSRPSNVSTKSNNIDTLFILSFIAG